MRNVADHMPETSDGASGLVAAVAELALRVGVVMISSAAAASEAAQAMLRISEAAGVEGATVDVNYSALLFSRTDASGQPYTRIATIGGRVFNYGRLTAILHVVERFCRGELTVAQAQAEAARVDAATGPWPWWLTRLAWGFAGGSAGLIFGGNWLVVLTAFAANVLLDYLFGLLTRRQWPVFFIQLVAGFIGVLAALAAHTIDAHANPSIVVIAVIIVMLAGMTTTGAIQDAITGWYMTGIGRILEAVTNTVGLIAGVKLGLILSDRIGVKLAITASVSQRTLQLWVMLIAAALIAIGFSFAAQNPRRIIPPVALLSAAAYAVDVAGVRGNYGPIWSAAAASFLAGAVAVAYGHRWKVATTAAATCAILPMLPGVQLYQGLTQSTHQLTTLVTAAATALALGGGMIFGEYIGTVVRRLFRLADDPFYTPLFADPIALHQRQTPAP